MNKLIYSLAFLIASFAGTTAFAQTYFAGFSGVARAQDSSGFLHSTNVWAATFPDCENQRLNAERNFMSAGYVVLEGQICSPRYFSMPDLYLKWPKIGPVCLSCPYLVDLSNLRRIYPERYKDVAVLVDQYQIPRYLKELNALQEKYGLQKFEQQLFKLEQQNMKSVDNLNQKIGY